MSCFHTFGAQVAFHYHGVGRSWGGWPGESTYSLCDMLHLDGWNLTQCFLKCMWECFSQNIEHRVGERSAIVFIIDMSGILCC